MFQYVLLTIFLLIAENELKNSLYRLYLIRRLLLTSTPVQNLEILFALHFPHNRPFPLPMLRLPLSTHHLSAHPLKQRVPTSTPPNSEIPKRNLQ